MPVSNAVILELAELRQNEGATWDTCAMWLRNLYSSEWPLADQLPRSTMSKAVSKLQAESKKIVKYGKDSKSLQQQVQFKEKIFVVPCVGKVESRVEQEGVHEQRDSAVEVAVEVSKQELTQKDDCAAKKSVRNLKLKVKRRDSEIQDLRETMHAHEKQVEQLDYELAVANKRAAEAKAAKRSAQLDLYEMKRKCARELRKSSETVKLAAGGEPGEEMEGDSNVFSDSDSVASGDVTSNLREIICELEATLLEKGELIEQLQEAANEPVSTFDVSRNCYHDFVRVCCMQLLSHGVSLSNVGPVIRAVLANFVGKHVDRLPSTALLSTMLVEMKSVSQMHAAEEVMKDGCSTLQTDATTKFGGKYCGYQVTTSAVSFSLGLEELEVGSAQRTLDVMIDMLGHIEESCKKSGVVDASSHELVCKVKNTMSDRGFVEKAFNSLFDGYRASVLPTVNDQWSELDCEARSGVSRVNHFFCGLHFLVGLAEQAEARLGTVGWGSLDSWEL